MPRRLFIVVLVIAPLMVMMGLLSQPSEETDKEYLFG